MNILHIYNSIYKNYYALVSVRDNGTVDGDEVYKNESTNLLRQELSSSCESYVLTEENIPTYVIKFDKHFSPCFSEIRKIGDNTIRSSQRVYGKEIRKQWSSYNEKTGEMKEGGKYVTVSTSSIIHFLYEDMVIDNRHYRYQRLSHFKKVRRSERKKNIRKEILLSLLYS